MKQEQSEIQFGSLFMISKGLIVWKWIAFTLLLSMTPSCNHKDSTETSEVKASSWDFELFLVQTALSEECCPSLPNQENFLHCVKESSQKRVGSEYLTAIHDLRITADINKKSFIEFICGDPRIQVY
jgi:hypothetical protein